MSTEISFKDLKIDMLSDNAMGLLAEFVCTWRARTGEIIDVKSEDAAMRVLRRAKRSTDRRLRSIYLHLRAEFTNAIENLLGQRDPMLAVLIMSHISRGPSCRFDGREFVS